MTEDFVQHLISLFRENKATELEYSDADFKIKLRRPMANLSPALESAEKLSIEHEHESTDATVTSQASGRYFRTNPLNSETVVGEGAHVEKGDVVGFLEVDGVMSSVHSQQVGMVKRIHANDGDLVGFDTVLLTVGT